MSLLVGRSESDDDSGLKSVSGQSKYALALQTQFSAVSSGVDVREAIRLATGMVYEDPLIAQDYEPVGSIRHVTTVGRVVQGLLVGQGYPADAVRLMTIGSVELPQRFRTAVRSLIQEGHRRELEMFDEQGPGYDLPAQGDYQTRQQLFRRLDHSYGFQEHGIDLETLVNQSAFVSGGMQGLYHILLSLSHLAPQMGRRVRFLHPDSRFGTYGTMADRLTLPMRSSRGGPVLERLLGEVCDLPTHQRDGFHLTPEGVREYRQDQNIDGRFYLNVWGVAPLSNPAATLMPRIGDTLWAALEGDEHGVVVLDDVYMEMMGSVEASRAAMAEVLGDPELRQRVIFVESASKRFALCRKRMGLVFACNNPYFPTVMNSIMTITAGSGSDKDGLWSAIAQMDDAQLAEFEALHEFWGDERFGLYRYLISDQFRHLFHDDQSHLDKSVFGQPFGLYVFLRVRDEVDYSQVFAETQCFGVPVELSGGKYIRFAVGMLQEPTFTKYL